jgi:hypothetical protein
MILEEAAIKIRHLYYRCPGRDERKRSQEERESTLNLDLSS